MERFFVGNIEEDQREQQLRRIQGEEQKLSSQKLSPDVVKRKDREDLAQKHSSIEKEDTKNQNVESAFFVEKGNVFFVNSGGVKIIAQDNTEKIPREKDPYVTKNKLPLQSYQQSMEFHVDSRQTMANRDLHPEISNQPDRNKEPPQHSHETNHLEKQQRRHKTSIKSILHNFPGNNKSAGINRAIKVLIQEKNGDQVQRFQSRFNTFLEKMAKPSSQIFLIFAYLFFRKERKSREMFDAFKLKMLEYYNTKRNEQTDEQRRSAIMTKIKPNIDLLNYLFPFDGIELNFQYIRQLSQPLYAGRQRSQLKPFLDHAETLYKQIVKELGDSHQQRNQTQQS